MLLSMETSELLSYSYSNWLDGASIGFWGVQIKGSWSVLYSQEIFAAALKVLTSQY